MLRSTISKYFRPRKPASPPQLVAALVLTFLLLIDRIFDEGEQNVDMVSLEHKWIKEYEPPFETEFGTKDYEEIQDDLFLGLGYKMIERSVVPKLVHSQPLECSALFKSSEKSVRNPPISMILLPFKLKGPFLLNGYSQFMPVSGHIEAETNEKTWQADIIKKNMAIPLDDENLGEEQKALIYAMREHKVEGKKGMVLGTGSSWIEATALSLGASNITTVGTSETVGFSRITNKHPDEISQHFYDHSGSYDFLVSFGAIESIGLGRQGEDLDPFRDLEEVQKTYCLLKRGGLLFLGLPIGWDILMWNYQRIYGRVRLALLAAGFDLINLFHKDTKSKVNVDWFAKPPNERLPLEKILEKDFGREVIWKRVVIVLRKR